MRKTNMKTLNSMESSASVRRNLMGQYDEKADLEDMRSLPMSGKRFRKYRIALAELLFTNKMEDEQWIISKEE